ncbi:O-antigen ligase [Pelagibius sp. Alg239-R121]|uniref:O-antigen ligase family protein n=1 Tax=Pelagibius sp. Alg239-R121 TaxID=2993448 RepID=UPI0024A6B6AA|nr:hypothetical protein [Pelagibius sp. Alg239-R121]
MVSIGVGNSRLTDKYHRIQGLLEKHGVFQWLYLGLVASFFLFDTKIHRLYFYVAVIPVFLVFSRWNVVRQVFRLPLWRLATLYLCYLWATQFWSDSPSLFGLLNQTRLLFMTLFFMTMTLYLSMEDTDFPERILRYFAWAGAIAAAAAIAYHLIFAEAIVGRMAGPGRAEHPIIGATLYGVAALCFLCCVARSMPTSSGRILGWGAFLTLIVAMLLTQSRGPLLSMVLVIFMYLLATGRWKLAILIPLPAVIYVALTLSGAIEPGTWITRGSTHRFGIWFQSWELITESAKAVMIGQGILTEYAFKLANGLYVKSPHNLFLANQLYGGIVASVLFIGLIATVAYKALQRFRMSGNFVVCALALFGLGVGLFDYRTVLINLSQEWMSFWLPVLLTACGWPSTNTTASRS